VRQRNWRDVGSWPITSILGLIERVAIEGNPEAPANREDSRKIAVHRQIGRPHSATAKHQRLPQLRDQDAGMMLHANFLG
jgi:hypothetical protein